MPGATPTAAAFATFACEARSAGEANVACSPAAAEGAAVAKARAGMATAVNADTTAARHLVLTVRPGNLESLMLAFP
jgi:hypothetical protein